MRFLVFDTESVVDASVAWEPPADKVDPFPPAPCHRVVCIGWSSIKIDKDETIVTSGATYGENEATILAWFGAALERNNQNRGALVSFNGRSHDMPVLLSRSMKHGVAVPAWWLRSDYSIRYKEAHLDLMDALSMNGAAPRTSLATWSSLVGGPEKLGHGSGVAELVNAGAWDALVAYCLGDVHMTAAVLVAHLVTRGEITKEKADEVREHMRASYASPRLIRGML